MIPLPPASTRTGTLVPGSSLVRSHDRVVDQRVIEGEVRIGQPLLRGERIEHGLTVEGRPLKDQTIRAGNTVQEVAPGVEQRNGHFRRYRQVVSASRAARSTVVREEIGRASCRERVCQYG